jgi:hypothetical protein
MRRDRRKRLEDLLAVRTLLTPTDNRLNHAAPEPGRR